MRSTILCGMLFLAWGWLLVQPSHAQIGGAAPLTYSNDAYVVRWQQDVMPITDVRVLSMLVSDELLREIATDTLELTDDQRKSVDVKISCHSGQEITEYGAAVQVSIVVSRRDNEPLAITAEQRNDMRRRVLAAWEENFSAAYRKAAKSRDIAWRTRVETLRHKQIVADERARQKREEYAVAERQLETHREQAAIEKDLDYKLSEYRMKKDEMTARRAALESQIKLLEKKGKKPDERAAMLTEQYERALRLEERRLASLQRRRGEEDADRDALDDQIHQAEIRVMEARIAIEHAMRDMAADDRAEALLEEVRNVNLELMHLTHTVRGIEQRREELASRKDDVPEMHSADVKQAQIEYELAERRLMRLNERLADLEDSGDNVVAPLTFIRLSD